MDRINDISKIKSNTGEYIHIQHHGVEGCAYIRGDIVIATLSHVGCEWVLHRGTQHADVLWRKIVDASRDIGWDYECAVEDAFFEIDRTLVLIADE